LGINPANAAGSNDQLWQHFQQNINNTNNFFFEKEIEKTKILRTKPNQEPLERDLGIVESHDLSDNILQAGDVETNPGPEDTEESKRNVRGQRNKASMVTEMEVITYNCRGLKEYKKLKRVLNTFSGTIKKQPHSLLLLQETHLGNEANDKINLMWRGKCVLSPGEGGARGCATLINSIWSIDDQFSSPDGRLSCIVISCEQMSLIVVNVYAPNDHSIGFFEAMFERIIEFRDRYPNHQIIVAGDFNLVINEAQDSVNRLKVNSEVVSSRLVSDNFRVLGLEDAYRKIEKCGGYTWARGNIFSRLDYVFMSNQIAKFISEANNDWTFDKSDHAAVRIRLNIPKVSERGPGIRKVNAEILKKVHLKSEFTDRVRRNIEDMPGSWDPNKRLEFLKVITRSILGELTGREKRIEDIEFEATCEQLNRSKNYYAECLKRNEVSLELEAAITELQTEVDEFQKTRAERIANKAKCRWFDEGEKSNKYFLNLLKRRRDETTLKTLEHGDIKANSQKGIEDLVVNFYSNLYDENKDLSRDFNSFFPELPQLNDEDRRELDKPITLEELKITLDGCKESSPGPDGIPYMVYKECWEVFGHFLLDSWKYCEVMGVLPDFNRASTIMLIPKEGKDPKSIGNWRPITLTNCDLKIFTKLLSNRVSKVLPKLILNTQVAYIPGRSVQDNLRMFEFFKTYCNKNDIDAVLVSLDAAKAFDSVDHGYMFETLKRFGFSDQFVSTVKMLYKDIKAEILVNGFKTTFIRIKRCVKQGDALSCALFIICLDPLLRNIENNKRIKHVEIKTPLSNKKVKNKSGAYADDVGAIVLKDEDSINQIFHEYSRFSGISGIKINETKSEIMSLKGGEFSPERIKVNTGSSSFELETVEKVKICGITFSLNEKAAHKANVIDKIDKMESNLIAWLHRGLNIPGKIVIINTFGISQLIYTMQCCKYKEDDIKRVEKMIFKFLWNKKWYGNMAPDRIKRDTLKGEYSEGGLKVPDILNTNEALKLKQFLRSSISNHPIKTIQQFLMEKLDYDFVYQQEYSRMCKLEDVVKTAQETINKITDRMREVDPLNLEPFQIDLLANTDVLEFLTRKNKALVKCYFKKLFEVGIESYIQLYREYQYPRSDEFRALAGLVMGAFPRTWQSLMRENEIDDSINLIESLPFNGSKTVKINRVTVKMLRKTLRKKVVGGNPEFPLPSKLGIVCSENVNPFLVARMANKSVALWFFKYRLLQGDMYTKERMFKFKMVNTDNCDFCGSKENLKHLLWDCRRVRETWRKLDLILKTFDPGGDIKYESLFTGLEPINLIKESMITRVTRSIVTREREGPLVLEKIKAELIQHCGLNIYSIKKENRIKAQWRKMKETVENNFL